MSDYKPQYKAGDRVVIKPWKMMEEQYGLVGESDHIDTGDSYFTKSMERALPESRIIEITKIVPYGNYLWEGAWGKHIAHEVILGYAHEYGGEIEVSNDGYNWRKAPFVALMPVIKYPVVVRGLWSTVSFRYSRVSFRYSRPVQKQEYVKIRIEDYDKVKHIINNKVEGE